MTATTHERPQGHRYPPDRVIDARGALADVLRPLTLDERKSVLEWGWAFFCPEPPLTESPQGPLPKVG